jgi:hypothetical protein
MGTDAYDGGLYRCLSKCHQFLIKHCISERGMTTFSSLVNFAAEADDPEGKKIRAGVMMTDNTMEAGLELATSRTAWVAGRRAQRTTPTTKLEPASDAEAPLSEVEFTEAETSWKLTHPNTSFDDSMPAPDSVTAHNFRESWRMSTLIQDKRPLDSVKTDYSLVLKQASSQLRNMVHIESVIDYYLSARALTQTWAFVGSYKVKSSEQGMKSTLYRPLGNPLLYRPGRKGTATYLQGGEPICKRRNDDRGRTERKQNCPDNRVHQCNAIVNSNTCGTKYCFRWEH